MPSSVRLPPPPYLPAKYDVADVSAIQALENGIATAEQQKRALKFIVYEIAGAYDLEYRTDQRDHAFASGRRFTGLQIIKMTKLNVAALKENKQTRDDE